MVRPAEQKMIVLEWPVCYSQFPREGGVTYNAGPHGVAPESVRRQRGERKAWARAFIWFL